MMPLRFLTLSLLMLASLLLARPAAALHGYNDIDGVSGTNFYLTAASSYLSTPDGDSLLFWGYSERFAATQYPGPTLIITQSTTPVTIHLTNRLPVTTSIIIPGFDVTASGGVPGMITRDAPPDGVTEAVYSFIPDRPGTYIYYSGTDSDLQVEMGLIGTIIVRPDNYDVDTNRTAYGDARSAYDQEYLFLITEMDPQVHYQVEAGGVSAAVTAGRWPVLWFINGRAAPDTMAAPYVSWLPAQPYNIMPMMRAGERMLVRWIGGGFDHHPFHLHGNNFDVIARDGYLLESTPGAFKAAEVGDIPDRAISDFTQNVAPGATYDAIFTWTGAGMGWDIYGHTSNDPLTLQPGEDPADHGLPFPVQLPGAKELTFGGFYSGSPFLGAEGGLPPGEGGNNPNSGFAYMWHSHNEKELTNNDIFPGGMITMMIVEAPGTGLP
jgi:FtsP/CotA-like multicopper oxidase with cupredoxin domain